MAETTSTGCSAGPALIFACSGAADVGAISDQAARQLAAAGAGRMFCLAGIGGRVPGIMRSADAAAKILAIDGCPLDCARRTLEEAGIKDFQHLQIAQMGMEKGKSPATEVRVARVVAAGAAMLQRAG